MMVRTKFSSFSVFAVVVALGAACAQTSGGQQTDGQTTEDTPDDPAPSYGSTEATALARFDQQREGLDLGAFVDGTTGTTPRVLEVIDNRSDAEEVWSQIAPSEPASDQDGPPVEEGVYGSPDDVDFDAEVMAVFTSSSGETTCPSWLEGLTTSPDGYEIHETAIRPECGDGDLPYTMIVSLDRAVFVDLDDLPSEDYPIPEDTVIPAEQLVTMYPADPEA